MAGPRKVAKTRIHTGDLRIDAVQGRTDAAATALNAIPFARGKLLSLSLTANVATIVSHKLGVAAAFIVIRHLAPGLVAETISQTGLDPVNQLRVMSDTTMDVDLWFYPRSSSRRLTATTGGGGGGAASMESANDNTIGSVTSATYADVPTPGVPLFVSLTTKTRAVVTVSSSSVLRSSGGTGNTFFMSVAVSGASTIAALDANCAFKGGNLAGGTDPALPVSRTVLIDGLTPGVNVFTLKCRCDGAVWSTYFRTITVQPLAT